MINTVYRRAARYYSAGEDRFVKRLKILCVHPLVQFQRNASHIDHSTVVAQRFVKLLFTGDLPGDSKLTANFTMGVKQRDMMAARRGINRESQPCRACADNGQVLFAYDRRYRHLGFVTGARVHQTGGHFADKDPIQTGLITTDTGVDLICASGLRFSQEFGIGKEGTRHRHHIGIAARQDRLGDQRIVNAIGRDQRNRHMPFEFLRHPAKGTTRYWRGDGRDSRLMPADAGIN